MTSTQEIVYKFLLAALLGGIIGAEREYRSKSAGFRTMIMIAVGSCFFTAMSSLLGTNAPERIASNIVTGIGFLGAGVIFRSENRVSGLTTAASIWVVSALGMGVGMGLFTASVIACILVLVVLAVLPFVEDWLEKFNQIKSVSIACDYTKDAEFYISAMSLKNKVHFKILGFEKIDHEAKYTLLVRGTEKRIKAFIDALNHDEMFTKVKY